jgi:hypothetical protein
MLGDAFKKVQPGWDLQIPADAYNAFIDAANANKARQHDRATGVHSLWRDASIVRVQNNSAQPIKQFGVLGIDGPAIKPAANLAGFQQSPMLACSTPNFAKHRGRFVVVLEPCDAGGMARAVVSGVAIVQIKLRHQLHRYADVDDGQTGDLASSHAGAAELLYVDGPAYLSQTSPGQLAGMSPNQLGGNINLLGATDEDETDDDDGDDGDDDYDEGGADDYEVSGSEYVAGESAGGTEVYDDSDDDDDDDDGDPDVQPYGGLGGSPLSTYTPGGLASLSGGGLKMVGNGLSWAIVRLGRFGPTFLIGKASGNIASGGSGTAEVWIGSPGEETDSGVSEAVESPFGGVTSGDYIAASWNGFGFYIHAEKCS